MTKSVKKQQQVNMEELEKNFSDLFDYISEALPRQARSAIAPAIEKFASSIGIDLNLDSFKTDRRVFNTSSGRPSQQYIAYWTASQRVFEGTLQDIASEIGCSVQVLYKHRNAAFTEHGEDAPFYKVTKKGAHEHVMILMMSDNAKDIINKRIAEFEDNLKEANRRFNEDGSY